MKTTYMVPKGTKVNSFKIFRGMKANLVGLGTYTTVIDWYFDKDDAVTSIRDYNSDKFSWRIFFEKQVVDSEGAISDGFEVSELNVIVKEI